MQIKQPVKLYIGSICCYNTTGRWAYLMYINNTTPATCSKGSDTVANTTNHRMELTAVIKAVQDLTQFSEICIFTDSRYLKQCIEMGWRWLANPNTVLCNRDLLIELNESLQDHLYKVIYIDNIMDNKYLELAHDLAREDG